ncbi:MAG: AsmA family protein, partial [Stagnimonas sp.]|nr:AsmA family protein [Stagnimonas sp.]
EASLRLLSGSAKAQADLAFASTLSFDAATGSVLLEDLKLTLAGERAGVMPAQGLAGKLQLESPGLRYDGASRKLDSGLLSLDIDGLRSGSAEQPKLLAKGKLQAHLLADLAQRRHELQGIELALDLGGSALPGGKAQSLKLQAGASADLAADSARLSALKLEFAGLKLSANQLLVDKLLGEQPELSGDLALAAFSPRSLLDVLGIAVPVTADPKVLATASFSGQLSATPKSLALSGLTLKLDDTSLRGDFALRDLASRQLAFNLKGDSLDADRYLPPKAKPATGEAAKPATPADKAKLNATELPVQALDQLNADGTLELAKLKVQGVTLSDVRLRLASPGGGLKRQQLSAGLYGGRADIALDVSNPASKPGYALKTKLAGINAGPLLKDFLGKDYVSGKGSVDLDLHSGGRTVGELRKALNGDVAFNFVDGAVKGFNLGKIIRDGQNLLAVGKGGVAAAASSSEPQATDFAELRGAGKFVNGVLKSDQLSAKNPLIRLEGAGEIDLVGETINYLAKPTLVGTAKGQGGKEMTDLAGVVIPIRLSGNLYQPKVAIDWQTALSQKATEQLRGKLGAALGVSPDALQQQGGQDLLKQKASEELNKGLLKLFGGGKKNPPPAEPAPTEPVPPKS